VSETDPLTIPFAERMPRQPLVLNNHSMAWISDRISGIVEIVLVPWAGSGLSVHSLEIRAIHTLPVLRAMQTAEEICKIETSEMQIVPE
jgi:hypothetical protein